MSRGLVEVCAVTSKEGLYGIHPTASVFSRSRACELQDRTTEAPPNPPHVAALIALALAILLAVEPALNTIGLAVSARAYAAEAGRDEPASSRVARKRVAEVKGLRTENSKTWVNNDGTLSSEISAGSTHWKDDRGRWRDFDTRIVPSDVPGFDYESNVGPFTVMFAGATEARTLVSARKGTTIVSFSPPEGAAGSLAIVKDSTITYKGIFPGVDLVYRVTNMGLKESLIVENPEAARTFTYSLESPTLTLAGTSAPFVLRDPAGYPEGFLSPAFALDGKGARGKVDLRAEGAGRTFSVTLAPDAGWLSDPKRTFPVEIDPSLVLYGDDGEDSYVQASYPTVAFGAEPQMYVDYNSPVAFVKFDLGPIPKTATILDGTLSLWTHPVFDYTGDVTVAVKEVTSTWDESTVTWNTSPTASGTVLSLSKFPYTYPDEGWQEWTGLAGIARKWLASPAANFGVKLSDYQGYRPLSYATGEYGDSGKVPTLTVTYEYGTGQKDWYPLYSGRASGLGYSVNLGSGNLMLTKKVNTISGRGPQIPLDLAYNSLSETGSLFGPGWTSRANTHLYTLDASTSLLYDGVGTAWPFVLETGSTTSFTSPAGFGGQLTKDDTGFTIAGYGGNTERYNSSGYLVSVSDPKGNAATLSWNSWWLQSAADASGRQTTFTNSGARIATSTDPAGRQTSFEYWPSGALKRITEASDTLAVTTDLTYYTSGYGVAKLKSATDANGHATTFVYDINGRVTEIQDARTGGSDTYKTIFQYYSDGSGPDPNGARTRVTAGMKVTSGATVSAGTVEDHYGDSALRRWKTSQDPDSHNHRTQYWYDDSNNQVTQMREPDSFESGATWYTGTAYDSHLNTVEESKSVASETYPTNYTYEDSQAASDLVEETLDGRRNSWENEYDSEGNQVNTSGPSDSAEEGLVEVTGVESYDAYGNPIETYQPAGWADNKLANSNMEIDQNGNGTPDGWTGSTSGGRIYSIDTTAGAPLGASAAKITAAATFTGSAYLLQDVTAGVTGGATYTASFYYKDNGATSMYQNSLIEHRSPTDAILQTTSFKPGGTSLDWRRASVTFRANPGATKIRLILSFMKYTTANTATAWYDGAQVEPGETLSQYNPAANAGFEKGAGTVADGWYVVPGVGGRTHALSTDAFAGGKSQMIQVKDNTSTGGAYVQSDTVYVNPNTDYTVQFAFKDNYGVNTTSFYNKLVVEHRTSTGAWISSGELKPEMRKGSEWRKAAFTFKTLPNEYQQTILVGYNVTATGVDTIAAYFDNVTVYKVGGTKTGYDTNANYATSETDSLGSVITSSYDSFGRVSSQRDASGTLTNYSYDSLDRLTGVTLDATGLGAATTYRYDGTGNLTSAVDALGHESKYGYNELGQRTAETDPLGRIATTSYDARGNVSRMDYPNHRTASFSYNSANEMTDERLYTNGSQDPIRYWYQYTANGQLLTEKVWENDNETYYAEYNYGHGSPVVDKTESNGYQIHHDMDGNGNVTALVEKGNFGGYTLRTLATVYDRANRPMAVHDSAPNTNVARMFYDEAGSPVRTERANGEVVFYEYDSEGRTTNIRTSANATALASNYSYAYDRNGNPTAFDADSFAYDNLNRMTRWVHSGATTTYDYDKAGNITKRGGTTYSYDAADQLQPYYSGGQQVQVSHDEAGNMTRHGNYSYAYDANNRLTSVTPVGGGNTIKYLYDPSGLLIRRTGDTTKAAFHWDGQTLVRVDYTGSTTYALSFTYDPAGKPLTVNRHSASGTSTYYYRTNLRGDVLDISNSSGTKIASYTYDPWGTITDSWSASSQSIKDENPLRYAGYIYDSATGLYYLRARWYAPSAARFTTRDPLEGVTSSPLTLNRYGYAEGSPLRNVDPTGTWNFSVHFSLTYEIARHWLGLSWATAYWIAAYDVMVDRWPWTKYSSSFHFRRLGAGGLAWYYLWVARRTGSLWAMGISLHLIQDYWAHGSRWPWQHDWTLDNPLYNRRAYANTVAWTYWFLSMFRSARGRR